MSRWKTGEKLIDEVESDWRKRIDNCAQFGFQVKDIQVISIKIDRKPILASNKEYQSEFKSRYNIK